MLEDFQFHREFSKWQNLFDKGLFFGQTQVGFLLFFQEEKDLLL